MAILEAGLIHEGTTLVVQKYYSADVGEFDDRLRSGLLAAINSFAAEAFKDNIESFTLSKYEIACTRRSVLLPGMQSESTVLAYAIMDKDSNVKLVISNLRKVMDAFMDRYTAADIASGDLGRFENFTERMDVIFADLRLKTDDRFKALF
jgi:hypothetical protein